METKPKTIIIRITQEQHDYLMRLADDYGCTLSELIRDTIQKLIDKEI